MDPDVLLHGSQHMGQLSLKNLLQNVYKLQLEIAKNQGVPSVLNHVN